MSTVDTDPPKAQRHLAAIIAADIVGYSGQMERDEVGTLGRLRDLRQNLIEPKVAEHRGRVFKTTGDGFLAEFVSVLEAVHCAVDIQRLMAARNLDLPEAGPGAVAYRRQPWRRVPRGRRRVRRRRQYRRALGRHRPARFTSAAPPATRSATGSPSTLRIWASIRSRISRGRSTSLECGWTA